MRIILRTFQRKWKLLISARILCNLIWKMVVFLIFVWKISIVTLNGDLKRLLCNTEYFQNYDLSFESRQNCLIIYKRIIGSCIWSYHHEFFIVELSYKKFLCRSYLPKYWLHICPSMSTFFLSILLQNHAEGFFCRKYCLF